MHGRAATPEERSRAESVFTSSLPTVWLVLDRLLRTSGLLPEDGEEFAAWAQEHLIRDDYAAVRVAGERFTDVSYLRVTLAHLLIDYRNHVWGRWRPSAVARRVGAVAVQLEQLTIRDGMTAQQAIQVMRSRDSSLTERELRAIIGELPRRVRDRDVDVSNASGIAAHGSPADILESSELRSKVDDALRRAFSSLPLEDQVIARMRFQDGAKMPEIARALGVESKPLYRRLDRILDQLRACLTAAGIRPEDVRSVIDLHSDGQTP